MRPRLRIQVVFQPTRLSQDLLRTAYELIVPIVERQANRRPTEKGSAVREAPTGVVNAPTTAQGKGLKI